MSNKVYYTFLAKKIMSKFVKFQLIKQENRDLDVAFKAIAKNLEDFPETACVKIAIIDEGQQKSNFISFGKGKSLHSSRSDEKVDFEVRINQEDCVKGAQGLISPIEIAKLILTPSDASSLDEILLLWNWESPPTQKQRLSQCIWLTIVLNSITSDKMIRVVTASSTSAQILYFYFRSEQKIISSFFC